MYVPAILLIPVHAQTKYLLFYRSVKHQSLRLMVFGDSKTGKTTLIERLKRRRHRAGRQPLLKHHGIIIKQWPYAPSSSDNTVKFTVWEFDNQVNCLIL